MEVTRVCRRSKTMNDAFAYRQSYASSLVKHNAPPTWYTDHG